MRRTTFVFAVFLSSCAMGICAAGDKDAPPAPTEREDFSLELPKDEQLHRLESEQQYRARVSRERGKQVEFPTLPVLAPHRLAAEELYPPQRIFVIPSVVCHPPLYFEDVKTEREMLTMGVLEPLRSAFLFYGRTFTLPARMAILPPRTIECHGN